MLRSNRTVFVGIVLIAAGAFLPKLIKLLADMGVFGGGWDGFGLFVIAIHLRPWIAGCGVIATLVGLSLVRKQRSKTGR
jgi:hypothetical protein